MNSIKAEWVFDFEGNVKEGPIPVEGSGLIRGFETILRLTKDGRQEQTFWYANEWKKLGLWFDAWGAK